jgi:2,3-bisphosphoglycerate-independent phosphoglycerate mutase
MKNKTKIILCILDGWGISHDKNNNAIKLANTPNIDYLLSCYPNCLIKTCGESVGLPPMQMGNSEVGHMTIGAGRVIPQNLVRINNLVKNHQNLDENNIIKNLVNKSFNKTCHILGMISDGGVHSHVDHIVELASFLDKNNIKVKLHAFTDGRDSSPKGALKYIKKLSEHNIEITSISGRYYAMDRDCRWDRTKLAYNSIVARDTSVYDDVHEYIEKCYSEGITDEFILPAHKKSFSGINNQDSLLFLNFRADRIRQIAESLVLNNFDKFEVKELNLSYAASMVRYSSKFKNIIEEVLTSLKIQNDLGKYLSDKCLTQLRVAETEKYAHVTYFFNCGREKQIDGEKWLLVDSPKVKTYGLKPEMSAYQITDKLIESIKNNKFDFICVNYANADMVGHTGDLQAAIKACSTIDQCVGKLLNICKEKDVELLITADHGNAEEMCEVNSNQIKTSHTINDVPLIYFGNKKIKLVNGELSDIAPTILDILKIPKPIEMSGKTLIR